ncbi:unnamed protein product [Ambrosiozyma monospora]|uniref:Unnamed protein product n=1 Tax=Ambrosiozyma monospora TaxID=43982 RepID=A0A9W6YRM4_AMBMO|nr:unnamed protein product [Ambrosiozyma monospora]
MLGASLEKAKIVKTVDVLQQPQEKDGTTTVDNNEHHHEEVINNSQLTTISPREIENAKLQPKEIINNTLPLRMIEDDEHHHEEVINNSQLTTIPPMEIENAKPCMIPFESKNCCISLFKYSVPLYFN